MCFSFLASIITGTLSYLSVIICWNRNITNRDRWNAIWIFLLGSMQWYDAYIWYIYDKGQDLHECAFNNWLVTLCAFITIMFEPIGNLFASMYYSTKQFIAYKTIILYIICFILIPCIARFIFGVLYDPLCGSWSNNSICSTITDTNHVLYGYGRSSDGYYKCWNKYYFFGEMQEEIPLILRFMFLIGIIYPYKQSKPLISGIINSCIIIFSWFIGYFYPPSHASVWCWCASLQSIYVVIFDPYLFPDSSLNKNEKNIYTLHIAYNIFIYHKYS
eukprot:131214_1